MHSAKIINFEFEGVNLSLQNTLNALDEFYALKDDVPHPEYLKQAFPLLKNNHSAADRKDLIKLFKGQVAIDLFRLKGTHTESLWELEEFSANLSRVHRLFSSWQSAPQPTSTQWHELLSAISQLLDFVSTIPATPFHDRALKNIQTTLSDLKKIVSLNPHYQQQAAVLDVLQYQWSDAKLKWVAEQNMIWDTDLNFYHFMKSFPTQIQNFSVALKNRSSINPSERVALEHSLEFNNLIKTYQRLQMQNRKLQNHFNKPTRAHDARPVSWSYACLQTAAELNQIWQKICQRYLGLQAFQFQLPPESIFWGVERLNGSAFTQSVRKAFSKNDRSSHLQNKPSVLENPQAYFQSIQAALQVLLQALPQSPKQQQLSQRTAAFKKFEYRTLQGFPLKLNQWLDYNVQGIALKPLRALVQLLFLEKSHLPFLKVSKEVYEFCINPANAAAIQTAIETNPQVLPALQQILDMPAFANLLNPQILNLFVLMNRKNLKKDQTVLQQALPHLKTERYAQRWSDLKRGEVIDFKLFKAQLPLQLFETNLRLWISYLKWWSR